MATNATDTDDNPREVLAPSEAMRRLRKKLDGALGLLETPALPASDPCLWSELDFLRLGREFARFALWKRGWEPWGEVDASRYGERDLYHHLLSELDIMSAADLRDRFRAHTEGAGVRELCAEVRNAHTMRELLERNSALGWGGLKPLDAKPVDEALLRRRRMMTDDMGEALTPETLRALDLSEAASLIAEAITGDMVTDREAERYFERIAGEAIVRFDSWNAWARSTLLAETFLSLEAGESVTEERTALCARTLRSFLEGPWAKIPWPRLVEEEEMPAVYGL